MMTLEQARLYKTAYHSVLEAFVGIEEVYISQVAPDTLIFVCNSYAYDNTIAFTEGELSDFCL